MSDILPLLLSESPLALLLVLEQNRALARLSLVLVSTNLYWIRMNFIVFEKWAYIFRFGCKGQSSQLQSGVISQLKVVLGRIHCLLRNPLLWSSRSPITIVEASSDLRTTASTDLTLPLLLSLFDFFEFNAITLSRYIWIRWEIPSKCNKLWISQVVGVEKHQRVSLQKS